jgi:hypothetical protein
LGGVASFFSVYIVFVVIEINFDQSNGHGFEHDGGVSTPTCSSVPPSTRDSGVAPETARYSRYPSLTD